MAVSPKATLVTRRQRALDRARELKLYEKADGDGAYFLVPSTSRRGRFYAVRVSGTHYSCNCQSGSAGWPCAHQAAVWLVLSGWRGQRVILREGVAGTSRAN